MDGSPQPAWPQPQAQPRIEPRPAELLPPPPLIPPDVYRPIDELNDRAVADMKNDAKQRLKARGVNVDARIKASTLKNVVDRHNNPPSSHTSATVFGRKDSKQSKRPII